MDGILSDRFIKVFRVLNIWIDDIKLASCAAGGIPSPHKWLCILTEDQLYESGFDGMAACTKLAADSTYSGWSTRSYFRSMSDCSWDLGSHPFSPCHDISPEHVWWKKKGTMSVDLSRKAWALWERSTAIAWIKGSIWNNQHVSKYVSHLKIILKILNGITTKMRITNLYKSLFK